MPQSICDQWRLGKSTSACHTLSFGEGRKNWGHSMGMGRRRNSKVKTVHSACFNFIWIVVSGQTSPRTSRVQNIYILGGHVPACIRGCPFEGSTLSGPASIVAGGLRELYAFVSPSPYMGPLQWLPPWITCQMLPSTLCWQTMKRCVHIWSEAERTFGQLKMWWKILLKRACLRVRA